MAVESANRLDKPTAISVAAQFRRAQDQHELLRNKLDMFAAEYASDPGVRSEYISDVRAFLTDTLCPLCSQLQTTSQYEQISRIADDWQTTLSELLREPINVRALIRLELPSPDLRPTGRRLTSREVLQSLRRRADETAQFRKLAQLFSQIDWLYRLTKSPEILHDQLPSTQAEMIQDWNYACQFLAADVLDGRLRVAEHLDPDGYLILTQTWLENTKRLMAYMRWLTESQSSAGAAALADNRGRYYYGVCESLHAALMNESRKASPEAAFDAVDWIRRELLDGPRLRLTQGSPGWKLVASKANRIWEQTGRADEAANWHQAEAYSRNFYEQIVPAIETGDRNCARSVLDALQRQRGDDSGCEIVSVFEAAIAIECLDPGLVRDEYHPAESYL